MSEEQEDHLKALLANQTRLVKAGEGIQRLQEVTILELRLGKLELQNRINVYNQLPWYKKMFRWCV